jgi:hypothetical protein
MLTSIFLSMVCGGLLGYFSFPYGPTVFFLAMLCSILQGMMWSIVADMFDLP